MRNKLLFLFILNCTFIVTNNALFAQKTKMGIKAGFGFPSLSQKENNVYAEGFKSTMTFEVGILAEFSLNDNWSIQPELLLTKRGGEKNGFQAIPPNSVPVELSAALPQGVIPYANFNNESNPTYLEVPVLVRYGWGNTWRFYVNAGPYIGFLIEAKQKTSGVSGIFLDPNGQIPLEIPTPGGPMAVVVPFNAETDVKDDLKTINFGIHGGVGILRKLNDKNELFFDARVSKGFIPIQKDEVLGQTTIGGFVFSMGYAYSFGS